MFTPLQQTNSINDTKVQHINKVVLRKIFPDDTNSLTFAWPFLNSQTFPGFPEIVVTYTAMVCYWDCVHKLTNVSIDVTTGNTTVHWHTHQTYSTHKSKQLIFMNLSFKKFFFSKVLTSEQNELSHWQSVSTAAVNDKPQTDLIHTTDSQYQHQQQQQYVYWLADVVHYELQVEKYIENK